MAAIAPIQTPIILTIVTVLVTIAATSTAVSAQTLDTAAGVESGPVLALGARVGGYGFRELEDDGQTWNACRMDGLGLFGTLDMSRHFFTEVGFEYYFATDAVINEGMDRQSVHVSSALGARMFPDAYVTPYVQLGIGAELTRVTLLDEGRSSDDVSPTGFFGIGGEANLTDQLKAGANLRFHAMALPVHSHRSADAPDAHTHGLTQQALEGPTSGGVEYTTEAAGQAQFFMRYLF